MSIPGIILLIAAAAFIYIYNGLVLKRARIENFLTYVKAFLKRRAEALNELLELLSEHNTDEYLRVKALLDEFKLQGAIEALAGDDSALTAAWHDLYDQLNTNYDHLDAEVKKLMERLELNGGYLVTVRKEYNQAVKNLNSEIKVAPWSIFAKLMKIKPATAWEIPVKEWYKPLKLTDFKS